MGFGLLVLDGQTLQITGYGSFATIVNTAKLIRIEEFRVWTISLGLRVGSFLVILLACRLNWSVDKDHCIDDAIPKKEVLVISNYFFTRQIWLALCSFSWQGPLFHSSIGKNRGNVTQQIQYYCLFQEGRHCVKFTFKNRPYLWLPLFSQCLLKIPQRWHHSTQNIQGNIFPVVQRG